jgi:hypothetical protein
MNKEAMEIYTDFLLARNHLKGALGDSINLLLAATAWNLSLWMRRLLAALLSWLRLLLPAFIKPSLSFLLTEVTRSLKKP